MYRKARQFFAALTVCCGAASAALLGLCGVYSADMPDSYRTSGGAEIRLDSIAEVKYTENELPAAASKSGGINAELVLFGTIPVKEVTVRQESAPMLVPCGKPFGIKILSDGVMVVGIGEVACSEGAESPAEDAGLKTGDIILKVNSNEVSGNKELQSEISSSGGKEAVLDIIRDEQAMQIKLTPVFSEFEQEYRAGIWVRDSCAGIGTMTWYNPTNESFAGLGHPICDTDTGDIVPLSSGEIVDVEISGVSRSCEGSPGELRGNISGTAASGTLTVNNICGVFGTLAETPENDEALPMAFGHEVHTGHATILSTIDGNEPREYDILIEKTEIGADNVRNMVIRIIDEELLSKTGGIVQGMSGSPIIQDGKLAGAVTHVFVSNPAKGFGIFAETMLDSSQT